MTLSWTQSRIFTRDEAAAVTAAKCGNDLLCCSSVDTQYPAVLEAVQNGEIPEAQVDASVKRNPEMETESRHF